MSKKVISLFSFIVSDFISIFISFALAFWIRGYILPHFFPSFHQRPVFFEIYLSHAYMFIVWVIVFFYEKLYTKRYSFWDETRLLLKSTTISFFFLMIAVFITQQYFLFSRVIIILAWIFSLILLPALRYLIKRIVVRLNLWKKKVIIINSYNSFSILIDAINHNRTLGYEIVGCFTDNREEIGKIFSGVKVLGHFEDLEKWKKKLEFEDIIVSLPDVTGDQLIELLKKWDQFSETIRYIPPTGSLITTGVEIENIGKVLSLSLRKNLHKPWNVFIKRLFEFVLALLSFVLLLPVFLVISIAIKIDTKGSVFFLQERFGKKGKKIKVIKFRSMYKEEDKKLKLYLKKNPRAKEEWSKYKKLKSFDPRVTKVGKILRKYSLDELPQFINVLIGNMSLVGPRPYIMEELKKVESVKSILLQVKPGITGLWQISGRSLLSFNERLNLDEYYLRNWSFWLDIIIAIKTIRVFLSAKGAY